MILSRGGDAAGSPITGGCSVPAAVPAWRTELPDLVEVVAVSRQWRRSSRPSAVRSWVAPRSPARTRREVLSQVLGQRPKLTASPGGQADPGAALLPGDQDEGTERDTGQQVHCGCGHSHAAVADRMAEY